MKSEIDLQRLCLKTTMVNEISDPIEKHRKIIDSLNITRKTRLQYIHRQMEEQSINETHSENSIFIEGTSICKQIKRNRPVSKKKEEHIEDEVAAINKNEGVGDMDRMVFDKKFKNYLNHKEEFEAAARRRRDKIKEKRRKKQNQGQIDDYYNEDQILSQTGSDYQYKDADDMQAAYATIATGKRRKKGVKLFYGEQFQFAFRLQQFEGILSLMDDPQKALISKEILIQYLFEEPMVMMLYSINPYLLGDELSEFETQVPSMLCFEEFSAFLLIDREPTYFQYTSENLEEAKKIGRGLKCAPIVGKWIDESGIYEQFMDIFDSVDMFGNGTVDAGVLVKKLYLHAEKTRILDIQVVQIVNINKLLSVSRLLYEIEHQLSQKLQSWTKENFQNYLLNYFRLQTPQKDRLITKLIMAGQYDTSYIYVISQEVLEILKNTFAEMQKFAEFFVRKGKFIQKLMKHRLYSKIKDYDVRSETNRYVRKETVAQTLVRMFNEADEYIDIEEILEFFTNRGRPRIIQFKVYQANLERQIAIIEAEEQARRKKAEEEGKDEISTSSDEQFEKQLKERKLKRKKQKLKEIQNSNRFIFNKKFNVTVPVPFEFDSRDQKKKVTIRERRVKQMIDEKRRQEDELMKPIPVKQVPKHVKQNLFEKLMKDQERERQERLERFRLQIKNSMVPMSDRLTKPKQITIHCDFSRQPYSFVARPMPWYCQVNLIDRINRKKEERKERILEEIINRHNENDLPEGVLRMLQRHEALQEKRKKNKSEIETLAKTGDCTFIPKITHTIPNFQALHENLNIDLEIARENKRPVFPEPFSFENRQQRSRTHNCYANMERNIPKQHKLRITDRSYEIKPTQKYKALLQKRQKERKLKQVQAEEQIRKEEIRKLREIKFAPRVKRVLRENDVILSKSRNQMLERVKLFQREEKQKKRKHEEEMIKIYTKVWNRPLLIETGQFGENEARNNSRYQEVQDGELQKFVEEQIPKEKISRKKGKSSKKKSVQNLQYEDKRRRAIQQPPGQYLLQGDSNSYEQGQEIDDEQMEQYIQQGLIDPREYEQFAAQMMNQQGMQYEFGQDDEEEGEYLSNQGMRTS